MNSHDLCYITYNFDSPAREHPHNLHLRWSCKSGTDQAPQTAEGHEMRRRGGDAPYGGRGQEGGLTSPFSKTGENGLPEICSCFLCFTGKACCG